MYVLGHVRTPGSLGPVGFSLKLSLGFSLKLSLGFSFYPGKSWSSWRMSCARRAYSAASCSVSCPGGGYMYVIWGGGYMYVIAVSAAHVCVYSHTYVSVHMHKWWYAIHMYVCTYIYVCIHMFVCTYIYICICLSIYVLCVCVLTEILIRISVPAPLLLLTCCIHSRLDIDLLHREERPRGGWRGYRRET
jgi:hypothetical protein